MGNVTRDGGNGGVSSGEQYAPRGKSFILVFNVHRVGIFSFEIKQTRVVSE